MMHISTHNGTRGEPSRRFHTSALGRSGRGSWGFAAPQDRRSRGRTYSGNSEQSHPADAYYSRPPSNASASRYSAMVQRQHSGVGHNSRGLIRGSRSTWDRNASPASSGDDSLNLDSEPFIPGGPSSRPGTSQSSMGGIGSSSKSAGSASMKKSHGGPSSASSSQTNFNKSSYSSSAPPTALPSSAASLQMLKREFGFEEVGPQPSSSSLDQELELLSLVPGTAPHPTGGSAERHRDRRSFAVEQPQHGPKVHGLAADSTASGAPGHQHSSISKARSLYINKGHQSTTTSGDNMGRGLAHHQRHDSASATEREQFNNFFQDSEGGIGLTTRPSGTPGMMTSKGGLSSATRFGGGAYMKEKTAPGGIKAGGHETSAKLHSGHGPRAASSPSGGSGGQAISSKSTSSSTDHHYNPRDHSSSPTDNLLLDEVSVGECATAPAAAVVPPPTTSATLTPTAAPTSIVDSFSISTCGLAERVFIADPTRNPDSLGSHQADNKTAGEGAACAPPIVPYERPSSAPKYNERPRSAPKTGKGRPASRPGSSSHAYNMMNSAGSGSGPPAVVQTVRPPSRGGPAPIATDILSDVEDLGAPPVPSSGSGCGSSSAAGQPIVGGAAAAAGAATSTSTPNGSGSIDRVAMIEAAFRGYYKYDRKERPESRKGSRSKGIVDQWSREDGLLPTGPDDADVIQSIESTDLSYQNAKRLGANGGQEEQTKRLKRPPSRKKDPSAAQGLGGALVEGGDLDHFDGHKSERPGFAVGSRVGKRPPSRHKEPPKALHLELDIDDEQLLDHEYETIDLPSAKAVQRTDSVAALRTTCRWAQSVDAEDETGLVDHEINEHDRAVSSKHDRSCVDLDRSCSSLAHAHRGENHHLKSNPSSSSMLGGSGAGKSSSSSIGTWAAATTTGWLPNHHREEYSGHKQHNSVTSGASSSKGGGGAGGGGHQGATHGNGASATTTAAACGGGDETMVSRGDEGGAQQQHGGISKSGFTAGSGVSCASPGEFGPPPGVGGRAEGHSAFSLGPDCSGATGVKKQRPHSSSAIVVRREATATMMVEDVDVDQVPTIVCTKPRPLSSSNRRLPFHTSLDHDFLELFAS
mmetsp:Transcript_11861/g.28732  ORF Transcript_11861/g.28732 Transcript_11861/m.28732 type:complete len:1093 (+) Transcript_11861:186-3464(+)